MPAFTGVVGKGVRARKAVVMFFGKAVFVADRDIFRGQVVNVIYTEQAYIYGVAVVNVLAAVIFGRYKYLPFRNNQQTAVVGNNVVVCVYERLIGKLNRNFLILGSACG